ncbi:transposase [Pseudomonas sp.]|uniref:REP-associated tyrosine transposase n=1 Tax=Pseudomonas sp. TaxID=306 RepID=UPI0030811876
MTAIDLQRHVLPSPLLQTHVTPSLAASCYSLCLAIGLEGNGMLSTHTPQGHRLRLGRSSQQGQIYLITTVLQNRRPLFTDHSLARLLIHELRAAHEHNWAASLAWVVMPDHLHWLLQLEQHSLPEVVRRIKNNSARHINRQIGLDGSIWQKGYHDRTIRHEDDLIAIARYVVANPLRAGLVSRIGDYPLWDAVWL